MSRKFFDCRDLPGDCTLAIAGDEEEVVEAQLLHAVQIHGQKDSTDLRDLIRRSLRDAADGRLTRNATMIALNVNELELVDGWVENEPSIRGRFDFPIHAGVGATSTARSTSRSRRATGSPWQIHTAKEIILVVAGEADGEVGNERGSLCAGALVLVPAQLRHRVTNTGSHNLRVVGFLSSAAVTTTFDEEIAPLGTRVLPIPPPDYAVQSERDHVEAAAAANRSKQSRRKHRAGGCRQGGRASRLLVVNVTRVVTPACGLRHRRRRFPQPERGSRAPSRG